MKHANEWEKFKDNYIINNPFKKSRKILKRRNHLDNIA